MDPPIPTGGKSLRWFLGPAVFDEASKQLSLANEPIPLEPKPAQVLRLLLRKQGSVLTHSELRQQVWANRLSVPHVIATAVGKVRKALATIPGVEIVSIPTIGYRLAGAISKAEVEQRIPDESPLKQGAPLPSTPEFTLVRTTGEGPERFWVGRHNSTGKNQLFRLAQTETAFLRLQREARLLQSVSNATDGRDDILHPVETNLSASPFYLRFDHSGYNLTDWALEHLKHLDLSQRIALFLHIADAVAALHNAGFLHQALTAENILMSGAPDAWKPCLANNGLHRGHRLHELGNSANQVANPAEPTLRSGNAAYLSPEIMQGGPHTTSSDVFALGVLLYQLVCGDIRRPIQPGWERDVTDQLLREDIAAATDGNPEQRTGSVSTLTLQIRTLTNRSMIAQQEQARELALQHAEARLLKLSARRPWVYAASILLMVIAVLACWLYLEADHRRRQAERYANSAQAVQQFLSEDVLAQTNPAHPQFKREASMVDVLDIAARHIDQRFGNDPLTLGVLRKTIAASHNALGNREASIRYYKKAIPLLEHQLGSAHDITLDAHYGLAQALIFAANFSDAEEQLRVANRLAGSKLSEQHPIALKSAIHGAQLHTFQLQPRLALPGYEKALQLIDAGVPSPPEVVSSLRFDYADALLRLDRTDDVIAVLAEPFNSVNDGQRSTRHRLLARAWRAKQDYAAALPHAQAALTLSENFNGMDHWNTIATMSTLSYLQFLLKNCTEAVSLAEQAYLRMAAREGSIVQGSLIELGNRGSRRFGCGSHRSGLDDLYAARNLLREHYGVTNAAAQSFALTLARNLGEFGEHDEALEVIDMLNQDSSAQIQATGAPSINPLTLQILRARLLHGSHRSEEALSSLATVLATQQQADGSEPANLLAEAAALTAEICTEVSGSSPPCPASAEPRDDAGQEPGGNEAI